MAGPICFWVPDPFLRGRRLCENEAGLYGRGLRSARWSTFFNFQFSIMYPFKPKFSVLCRSLRGKSEVISIFGKIVSHLAGARNDR